MSRDKGQLKTMWIWLCIVSCSLANGLSAHSTGRFETGDYLFVQARVLNCDHQLRNIDVSEVGPDGFVNLFGTIEIGVLGHSPEWVADMIADVIQQDTGRRPESIRVERVPGTDPESAAWKMLEIVQFVEFCRPDRPGPFWQDPLYQGNVGWMAYLTSKSGG